MSDYESGSGWESGGDYESGSAWESGETAGPGSAWESGETAEPGSVWESGETAGPGSAWESGESYESGDGVVSIDASDYPELSWLAQSGSLEGWLSSVGVAAAGITDSPCESQFFGAEAAAMATIGGLVALLFGPDPLTKTLGFIGVVGGVFWYIQALEDLAACMNAQDHPAEASAILQHTQGMRAECDRLQSLASA